MIEKRRWLYFIGGAMFFLGLIIGKHHGGSVVALVGFLVMAGSVPLGIWSARRKRQLSLERESRKSE
jgi:Flp pilus assembly protein TadB